MVREPQFLSISLTLEKPFLCHVAVLELNLRSHVYYHSHVAAPMIESGNLFSIIIIVLVDLIFIGIDSMTFL